MAIAASVLATAKSRPSTPAVSTNIEGSITGEASQKAITGGERHAHGQQRRDQRNDAAGAERRQPAGKAASRIISSGEPVKALAMRLSAPEAPA
jgi:hypothetical protein